MVKHVFALAPNWVGDVAMCTPALRALARHFPEARFTVAARKSGCDLLAGLPWISDYLPLPARAGFLASREVARTLGATPDLAVVFPHSFRAALFAWQAGARDRVGYDRGGRRLLLTQAVAPHRVDGKISPIYMVDEYLGLARAVGAEDDAQGLELFASAEDRAAVRSALPSGAPVVAIAPGAAFGPSKCWPAERYAAVADRLAELRGAVCVLLTGPGEEATRDAVLRAAKRPLIDVQGGAPSIARLKAAIAECDLLIGNDSGPRHIAVAFKRPVICLMGSTRHVYSCGPYERGEVLRVDVDCGPCQQPVCATDHRCMTLLTVGQTVEAALRWLP